VSIRQLYNATLGVEPSRYQALAAQHMAGAEPPVEHIEMPHAIEERDHHGIGADGGSEVIDRCIQVVGLATEENYIERVANCPGEYGGWRWQGDIARITPDDETNFGKPGAR